jgi:lipid-A-disaccharide synthase
MNGGGVAEQHLARVELGLPETGRCLALMPGSRRNEIARLGPVFIKTALRVRERNPALQFLIPCANHERFTQATQLLAEAGATEGFHVYDGQSHQVMRAADIVLLASGTATLEAMLLKRPMVVAYSLSPLTYALASRMLKVPYVSLPNLLAGERLVAEFLQYDVTVDKLSAEIERLLNDAQAHAALLAGYRAIHEQIRCDADTQAAKAVLEIAGMSAPQGA